MWNLELKPLASATAWILWHHFIGYVYMKGLERTNFFEPSTTHSWYKGNSILLAKFSICVLRSPNGVYF